MTQLVRVPGRSTLPHMNVLISVGWIAKIRLDVAPCVGSGDGAVVKAEDLQVRSTQ